MPDVTELFNDLVRLQIELWNAADARLRADFDLALADFLPMQVIAETDTCRVYDIADALVITVGGTSKTVDRIEASGYCRRRANPDDRRSSIIELTPAGKRILSKATVTLAAVLEQRLGSAISARALTQFGATLSKLRSAGHQLDSGAGTTQ